MNILFKGLTAAALYAVLACVHVAHAVIKTNELTIHYASLKPAITKQGVVNHTLLLTDADRSNLAGWQPEPIAEILLNTQVKFLLKNYAAGAFSGTVSYAIADYCVNGLCDANYRFTVHMNALGCSVDKTNLGQGEERTYEIDSTFTAVGKSGYCQVNVVYTSIVEPEPQVMHVVVQNQLGQTPGEGDFSYALVDGNTQAVKGKFDVEQPVSVAVNQSTQVAALMTQATGDTGYQGTITYNFDDESNAANLPMAALHIKLDNSSAALADWCQAAIVGDNQGERQYAVEKIVVAGAAANATCTLSITAQDNPTKPPRDYQFEQFATLPTDGALSWEHFVIDKTHYLAAANASKLSYESSDANVFKLAVDAEGGRPTGFTNLQFLSSNVCYDRATGDWYRLTNHPYHWQHFNIAGVDRIAMANYYSHILDPGNGCRDITYSTTSSVYTWDTQTGLFNQSHATIANFSGDSPRMTAFYQVGEDSYMAVAESYLAQDSAASIFKWDTATSKFVKMTEQPALQAAVGNFAVAHIETFSDAAGQVYLVLSRTAANQDVLLFSVDTQGILSLYQGTGATPNHLVAPTGHVNQSLVFKSAGNLYMVLGYHPDQLATVSPFVYQWVYDDNLGKSVFVSIGESLPAQFKKIQAWDYFRFAGRELLAVAAGTAGAAVYVWDANQQQIRTEQPYTVWSATKNDTIVQIKAFTVGDDVLLALARHADATGNTHVPSPIMRMIPVQE